MAIRAPDGANKSDKFDRADLLFKETIEMIASCYNQHFDVSIVMYVPICNAKSGIYFTNHE